MAAQVPKNVVPAAAQVSPAVAQTPVAAAGSSSVDKLKAMLGNFPLPVFIIVTLVMIAAVVVFIVIKVKRGSLKSIHLLKRPVVRGNPLEGDYMVKPAGKMPTQANGAEFTYSLWLFVDNVTVGTDHKLVLYRGNTTSFKNGFVYIYMDSKTNRLYCSLRTNGVRDESASNLPSTTEPKLLDIAANRYFMKSSIEYIPLQRWVNVIYSFRENVLSTFLDGELYSVTSVYEMPATSSGERPMVIPALGDVMIGGKAGREGVNGYLGNFKYFNYSLTLKDAQTVYRQGPYQKSWLSLFGMAHLGVRSPLYKIEEVDNSKTS